MTYNVDILLRAKDAASGPIGRIGRSLHGIRGAGHSAASGLLMLTKVGIIGIVGGITAAIGAMTAGLSVAASRAKAEEKGIARLDAALKANVKNWKGNRAGIEQVIKANEALGFSDDSLRDSYSILIGVTHNVTEANKLQATAMDLARAKGISLAQATKILSAAHEGQFRSLKSLGIGFQPVTAAQEKLRASGKKYTKEQMDTAKAIDKQASETAALEAIQKNAKGQAEAYGKTAAGAQEAFQVALNDVMEDLGKRFLPMMTEAFTWLRTTGLPAVQGMIDAAGRWVAENQPLITQISTFVRGVLSTLGAYLTDTLAPALSTIAANIGDWIRNNQPLIDQISKFVGGVLATFVDALGKVLGFLGDMFTSITDNKDVMNTLQTFADLVGTAFQIAATAVGDLVGFLGDVWHNISTNKTVMDTAKAFWDGMAQAIGDVVGFLKWIIDNAGKAAAAMTGPARTAEQDRRHKLGLPGGASGGMVGLHGPELMWVGEKGPEYIVPNHELRGMGGGGAIVVHSHLYLDGRQIAQSVDRHQYSKLQRAAPTALRT